MVLTVPYIGISEKQQAELDSILPVAKFLKMFMPMYFMNIKKPTDTPWFDNWLHDPMMEGFKMNAHNLVEVQEIEADKFTKIIPNVNTPLLMILAKGDKVVCNDTAKKALEIFPTKDKTFTEVDEPADHLFFQDREYFD